MSEPKLNSSLAIAKLLATEGFSDHVASLVARHALKMATPGQRKRYKRNKKLFSEMIQSKLTEADKQILGKFISMKLAMSFDIGLRMGITAFLYMPEKDRRAFILEMSGGAIE